jgi:hypothetical protein
MSKPIVLTHSEWEKLRNQLYKDYSRSIIMISWKMKEKLGFTVREYQAWREDSILYKTSDIRLDFYSEPKRTMFMLKYSEYLGKDKASKLENW